MQCQDETQHSALFGMGKLKHLKLLQCSQLRRSDVQLFRETSASLDDICTVGEDSVLLYTSLYSSGSKSLKSLDELLYLNIVLSKCFHN